MKWILGPLVFALAACSAHAAGGNLDAGPGSSGPPDAATCPAPQVMDPATGTCVDCLPGSDTCGAGQYCTDQGTCTAGCDADSDCGAGQGCCDHTCKDLNTLSDCGTCGNACASGDFCDGTQCNTPTYPNFCANKNVYVIYDGISPDEHAADVMASTITANCPPDVMVHTGTQTDPALVDQATGQPLAGGGVTYVLGGGPFASTVLKWLEQTQVVTKVYFDAPDGINYDWVDRTNMATVASMPANTCSPQHDQFVSELVTDPMSGTLSLIGYGACVGGAGTQAAAWYYANVMLPNAASYPDSWYVVDWTDADGDSAPSAGDAFTILAHGL